MDLTPRVAEILKNIYEKHIPANHIAGTMDEKIQALQGFVENILKMTPSDFYDRFSISYLKEVGMYTLAHHIVLRSNPDVKEGYEHDFKNILLHSVYPDLLKEKGLLKEFRSEQSEELITDKPNEYRNLSQEIVKNRVRIEKTLASKYDVSVGVFAELFQVPGRVIEKEVEKNNIEFTGKEPYSVNAAKYEFYKMVDKMETMGFSREDSLAMFGFWTEAEYFGENIETLHYYTPEMDARIAKAIQMIEYGYTNDTVKKAMSHEKTWTMLERDTVKSATKGIDVVFGAGKQTDFADRRLKKGDSVEDIIQANGTSRTYMMQGAAKYERSKELSKKYREKYKEERKNDPDHITEETKRKAVMEYRRGYGTQTEIAEKYGVRYETILAWNRHFNTERVVDHTLKNETVPTRRQRNTPSEKKLEIEARTEAIVSSYLKFSSQMVSSKAIAKTSKILKCHVNTVYDALRKEGIIKKVFEGENAKEHIDRSSEAYKEAYKKGNLAFFGKGPNAGHSTDEDYIYRIRDQRELGYELSQEERARKHAKENAGDMTSYWSEKETDLDKE